MSSEAIEKINSNPASTSIYAGLLKQIRKFGNFEIEGKKTSVHITHGRAFLGVHPRQSGILINIVTDEALSGSRIKKMERVSANRYHTEIVLNSVTEINTELLGWIERAYALTEK